MVVVGKVLLEIYTVFIVLITTNFLLKPTPLHALVALLNDNNLVVVDDDDDDDDDLN